MMDTAGIMELVKVIGNYGVGVVCLAVLILLHIYNVRVTLPELAKTSREEVQRLVTIFREELAAERAQCHDDHLMLQKTLEAVRDDVNRLKPRRP